MERRRVSYVEVGHAKVVHVEDGSTGLDEEVSGPFFREWSPLYQTKELSSFAKLCDQIQVIATLGHVHHPHDVWVAEASVLAQP